MWVKSNWFLSSIIIVFFFTLHQGETTEPTCGLVLSKTKQSLAVRVGSSGELTCQISGCAGNKKRIIGPFWRRPDGKWFQPNMRIYSTKINSTTISLRYSKISHLDFGLYICMVKIGADRLKIIANITEKQGNEGDVDVTPGPEGTTKSPRKKRNADKGFYGGSIVQAMLPRKGFVKRSVQDKTWTAGNLGKTILKHSSVSNEPKPMKGPCNKEKLFSKTGIIIVTALVCSTFLLLYMVILLMAVPRICFPYYPKKKRAKQDDVNENGSSKNKDGSSSKVNIPLSHKARHNGRSDSGIESVDGLEEKGSNHCGGRSVSHWEIGADKLEEFYHRTRINENEGSEEEEEDMLSGLKIYNMNKNIPRRGRSESVPLTPYRYQSSIYVKV